MRSFRFATLAVCLALLGTASCARSQHDQARGSAVRSNASAKADGPTIGDCPIFPANNVWNTPVDKLPKNSLSDTYMQSIGLDTRLHPDFGSNPDNGIPINIISEHAKRVKVTFRYREDSDLSNYPIPPNALIEGGSQSTDDRHVLLVDDQRCILYELFSARPSPDGSGAWTAGSGIIMDLTSNALRPDGKTSADAAGLPILPGLIRYDEVASGEIRHAIRFTVPHTQKAHIWPARHDASANKDPSLPPMGLRLRLRASFDISGYSKTNQVILRAMQRYGIILSDNGSGIFIIGAPDPRWNDTDLHRLGQVTGKDFEAVDESDLPFLANSGRVDPLSVPKE